jgi:hypothetical protein
MIEPILLKIVLMLDATVGASAPAETATKPAINAYSIRSWPLVLLLKFWSRMKFLRINFFMVFVCSFYPHPKYRTLNHVAIGKISTGLPNQTW